MIRIYTLYALLADLVLYDSTDMVESEIEHTHLLDSGILMVKNGIIVADGPKWWPCIHCSSCSLRQVHVATTPIR